jgi:hypothetical protein
MSTCQVIGPRPKCQLQPQPDGNKSILSVLNWGRERGQALEPGTQQNGRCTPIVRHCFFQKQ